MTELTPVQVQLVEQVKQLTATGDSCGVLKMQAMITNIAALLEDCQDEIPLDAFEAMNNDLRCIALQGMVAMIDLTIKAAGG